METPQHLSLGHVQGSRRVLSACSVHQRSLVVEPRFVPAPSVCSASVQRASASCLEILTERLFSRLLEGRH